MAHTIERQSPIPYWEQLSAILRGRILSGEFPIDGRLPSELELCRDFGLSRATVRQTLLSLENEGFARRVARRGVFATIPEEPSGWTVQEGFLESQVRHGRTGISTKVVSAGVAVPPPHVAEALRIDGDAEVFAIERVRGLDGMTAMFSTNWFPAEVGDVIADAADVLRGDGSVNATLARSGFVSSGARRTIHALRAPADVAEHLEIGEDEPVLRVRSLSWDQSGRRFDYYETWVLTGVIPLEVSVSAS